MPTQALYSTHSSPISYMNEMAVRSIEVISHHHNLLMDINVITIGVAGGMERMLGGC